MGEPATIKERMEALGWHFEADYDPDGVKLCASAVKLPPMPNGRGYYEVRAYHTDAEYTRDHAACRAAWEAEWDAASTPKEPAHG